MSNVPYDKILSKKELVGLLAESIGQEKASNIISESALRLGLHGENFNKEEVMKILDLVAEEPGLVGIVARFVKARAILALH